MISKLLNEIIKQFFFLNHYTQLNIFYLLEKFMNHKYVFVIINNHNIENLTKYWSKYVIVYPAQKYINYYMLIILLLYNVYVYVL